MIWPHRHGRPNAICYPRGWQNRWRWSCDENRRVTKPYLMAHPPAGGPSEPLRKPALMAGFLVYDLVMGFMERFGGGRNNNERPTDIHSDTEDTADISRRAVLKGGLGLASAAALSSAGYRETLAQAPPLSLSPEKLPPGTVEVIDTIRKRFGNREYADITAVLEVLIEDRTIDLDLKNAGDISRAKNLINNTILPWNVNQPLENRIAFLETSSFSGEYSPLFKRNGDINLPDLRSLRINVPAIKRFLEGTK